MTAYTTKFREFLLPAASARVTMHLIRFAPGLRFVSYMLKLYAYEARRSATPHIRIGRGPPLPSSP